jgi:hypothetical protein
VNVPKAVEIAIATMLRKRELGAGVMVRPWQSLKWDGSFKPTADAVFPCVDVRCSPPRATSDGDPTMICDCSILCASLVDEDRDHAVISRMYGEVQAACDAIYAQFKADMVGVDIAAFLAAITTALGSEGAIFSFGGFILGDPSPPFDDAGKNMIGFSVQVHYSRSDFN